MQDVLWVFAAAFFGAFAFRIRGGWLSLPSTFLGRGFWGLACGLIAYRATMSWEIGLSVAVAGLVACMPGHAEWLDLGTVKTPSSEGRKAGGFWEDFSKLGLRGLWWTAPVGGVLAFVGYDWWYIYVGLLQPVAYEIGHRIPIKMKGFQGAELGEFLFGAVQGTALGLLLMKIAL